MIEIFLFIIGLCVGSFLNVVIDRIPAGKSIIYGRSHCDFCKHYLAWYDLLPVVSYASLLGRCRYCQKSLSFQYPLIEITMGVVFVAIYLFEMPINTSQFILFFLDLFLTSIAFALIVMDAKYHMLSDMLLLFLFLLSFLRLATVDLRSLPLHLLIGLLSAIPLLVIFLFTKGKGMGFGDVKLIAILGFLLGFPQILLCYYFAFLTGGVTGTILILSRKKKFHGATIAFGPFLFIGAGIAIVWGEFLWSYAKLLMGL